MKKLIFIGIYVLNFFVLQSQELYFNTALSGLNIREEPKIDSKKIGKLPYGSVVKLLDITDIKLQIKDNDETLNGVWVKIKFQNFPFIISESKKDVQFENEGYVFSAFIEKLNKASIEITEIDSLKFYSHYVPPKPSNRIKITSKQEAEQVLEGKVKWTQSAFNGRVIDEIILDSGQILKINQVSNDFSFIAYFPTEEIILFEGGHASDFSISTKTGETLKTVGNPEYIIESPSKKIRLNGFFGGQECSHYFFQVKTGDTYTYLTAFNHDLCYYDKFYWLNDQEFIYSETSYATTVNGNQIYYLGKIQN
ncbi:SH3 domain-containing protein [Winogradskyella eckloniae]|uniref:SH3 domain-containing protein n=1 Tax=Winogradskyella eckloniae TaxID=1089306 RepID=UPI001563532F|nr:SH3 domain-containing protein [Winogradskyella eckloniae]NRD20048.1 SH3 domain-containing protein [Winogradskyella eckloniae]